MCKSLGFGLPVFEDETHYTIRVEQIALVSDLRACGNELMFSYLGKKYLIWKEFMGDILFTRTFPGGGVIGRGQIC